MVAHQGSLRTISVGIDGSPGSQTALRWAFSLAEPSETTVQAVMAWRYPYIATMPGVVGAVPPMADMESATSEALSKVLADHPTLIKVEPVVAMGSGAQVLVDASLGQDLLVVGRRERSGLKGLGSTSRHVAIHAWTSVAVIPFDAQPVPAEPTIAVAVDGSDRSVDALVWAGRAFPAASHIVAVHSHDEQMLDYHGVGTDVRAGLHARAEKRLEAAVKAALARLGPDTEIERRVFEGDPRSTVFDGIWGADALVVGDRGHQGVSGLLLGSFATFAVGHSSVPTVVARKSEFTK